MPPVYGLLIGSPVFDDILVEQTPDASFDLAKKCLLGRG
jgi:hypothetical protein